MAISFVAAADNDTGGNSASVTSLDLDVPVGTTANDVMVMFVSVLPSSSAQRTFTAPSGWTLQRTMHETANDGTMLLSACIMIKVAGTEPASYTVNFSGACDIAWGGISTYRGATGRFVVENYGADTNQTSPVTSSTINNTQSTGWRLTAGTASAGSANTYATSSSEVTQRWGGVSWVVEWLNIDALAAKFYDSNGAVATGNTSRNFQHGGGGQAWYAGLCWVGILEEGSANPTTGTMSMTLRAPTVSIDGNEHNDATTSMTLAPVTQSFAGNGAPIAVTGTVTEPLAPATMDMAGSSPVSGVMDMVLPITFDFVAETRFHGIRVITVDADDRTIKVESRGVDD